MEKSGSLPSVYVGTYEHSLDDKARIILPGAFRQALGKTFILSAGFDRCLALWRRDEWNEFVAREISKRSDLSGEARRLSRWFHASAHLITVDSQSRFVVPPPLRSRAALEREVVLTGVGNRVEIWSAKLWRAYSEKTEATIEEIAESLSQDLRV